MKIPEHLLPVDGRFASGPSKVRQAAVESLAASAPHYLGTSHRHDTVRSVVGRLRAGLSELFELPDGYQVVLGVGGTTCFWDAASFCLVRRKSQHLSFGEFSSKFAQVASKAPHLEAPAVIESAPGTHPLPAADPSVDLYALTQNETSTGVSMEIRRPAGAEGLVAVDATSAAGGLRVDLSEADAYFFSPQKCFGSEGGLWVALMSPAAADRVGQIAAGGRWVPAILDLSIAIENSSKNQTYNTPALATVYLFAQQVEWMLEHGGLEWAASRCDRSAAALYGWADRSDFATPFVAEPAERSHVVGTIDLDPEVDALEVAKALRDNGVVDTEPYRKLGRNQLRIAMFPNIEPEDVVKLTRCVDYVVSELPG